MFQCPYSGLFHFYKKRRQDKWNEEHGRFNALTRACFIFTLPLGKPYKSRLVGLIFAGYSQNILKIYFLYFFQNICSCVTFIIPFTFFSYKLNFIKRYSFSYSHLMLYTFEERNCSFCDKADIRNSLLYFLMNASCFVTCIQKTFYSIATIFIFSPLNVIFSPSFFPNNSFASGAVVEIQKIGSPFQKTSIPPISGTI